MSEVSHYNQRELGAVIGQIYDCAVDPELWIPTLTAIRDRMDLAYVHLLIMNQHYSQLGDHPGEIVFQTSWSQEWMESLKLWYSRMPVIPVWMKADIDEPMSQLQVDDEEEVKKTPFYLHWAKPQNLRDYCQTALLRRADLGGGIGAASYNDRHSFDERDRTTLRLLAPHLRRAMLIGGMLDEGKYALQLYRSLMDKISSGILILSGEGRLVFANAAADRLLTRGACLTARQGRVSPTSLPQALGFTEALARACSGEDSDLGLRGNGIPLPGADGSSAVCYVLPLGNSERRRELGPGLTAVFISTGAQGMPPAVEVLSALTGMTTRESHIALMIAGGSAPNEAAQELGISINTVRSHIARVFEKTGVSSQLGLARHISGLSLPLMNTTAN
jgi:DNA-binding CsgD family transcriptional regulator/PAS domain-containing protein